MLENMNQDKAIFMSQCSALPLKNNEILVHILPFKSAYYLFLVPLLPLLKSYNFSNKKLVILVYKCNRALPPEIPWFLFGYK